VRRCCAHLGDEVDVWIPPSAYASAFGGLEPVHGCLSAPRIDVASAGKRGACNNCARHADTFLAAPDGNGPRQITSGLAETIAPPSRRQEPELAYRHPDRWRRHLLRRLVVDNR
jgi:hypothetical protein